MRKIPPWILVNFKAATRHICVRPCHDLWVFFFTFQESDSGDEFDPRNRRKQPARKTKVGAKRKRKAKSDPLSDKRNDVVIKKEV